MPTFYCNYFFAWHSGAPWTLPTLPNPLLRHWLNAKVPTSTRVQLNFSLSMYLDDFHWAFLLSGNFGLRPKFLLSEITSLFGLTLYLNRFLAQREAQRKAKSKRDVTRCICESQSCHRPKLTAGLKLDLTAFLTLTLMINNLLITEFKFPWNLRVSLTSIHIRQIDSIKQWNRPTFE